jgi:hypothetical protein
MGILTLAVFCPGALNACLDDGGRRAADGMRADWEANRDELMEFWRSGESESFADSLPRLSGRGSADTLPWAARHLD